MTDGDPFLSVDVEDYYMVEAFTGSVRREDWGSFESRVEGNTRRVLEILGEAGARGTFFVLGHVAERHAGLVREIEAAGHEVASHGHCHRMVTSMDRASFREDVARSKAVLEEICGREVIGYRAPTFSIVPATSWAHGILREEGYRYSSSVFPIRHDRYGWPDFGSEPRPVHGEGEDALWEFPLSVGTFLGAALPYGGGGYFRLYPYWLSARFFRQARREGRDAVFYIHPWEIDEGQPSIPSPWTRRLRHHVGIPGAAGKIRNLLRAFRFRPFRLHPALAAPG